MVTRATSNQEYQDLADEIESLRVAKQKILVDQAADKGKQKMRESLIDFLDGQDTELKEFDEILVRRLIDQVIIHEDCTYTVDFKSVTRFGNMWVIPKTTEKPIDLHVKMGKSIKK